MHFLLSFVLAFYRFCFFLLAFLLLHASCPLSRLALAFSCLILGTAVTGASATDLHLRLCACNHALTGVVSSQADQSWVVQVPPEAA